MLSPGSWLLSAKSTPPMLTNSQTLAVLLVTSLVLDFKHTLLCKLKISFQFISTLIIECKPQLYGQFTCIKLDWTWFPHYLHKARLSMLPQTWSWWKVAMSLTATSCCSAKCISFCPMLPSILVRRGMSSKPCRKWNVMLSITISLTWNQICHWIVFNSWKFNFRVKHY